MEVFPEKIQLKKSPLILWKYKNHIIADGLFRLHDELGFSLTCSLIECSKYNLTPAIEQFKVDAILAGWSMEKINQTVDHALVDSIYSTIIKMVRCLHTKNVEYADILLNRFLWSDNGRRNE